jgi:hypothetical protein
MDDPQHTLARRQFIRMQLELLLPGALLSQSSTVLAEPSAVVPIVSSQSRLRDISLGTLERVFLGEPVKDSGGQRFVPFNHPPRTQTRVLFDGKVLNMSPDEVARYWVDQRIRGRGNPPRSVASVSLRKEVVGRFPGAISYIPVGHLGDDVRPLTVGGVPFDSPKYPIR